MGARGQIDLQLRVREHHGPDIAAVHHHGLLGSQLLLEGDQAVPHLLHLRDPGGHVSYRLGPKKAGHIVSVQVDVLGAILVGDGNIRAPAGIFDPGLITGIHSAAQHMHGHGAVHRAGIHVDKPQLLRRLFRDRALAGPGRSVDCNLHVSSPSFRIMACAAAFAVVQAICRLKPPVQASRSRTSPIQ